MPHYSNNKLDQSHYRSITFSNFNSSAFTSFSIASTSDLKVPVHEFEADKKEANRKWN